MSAEADICNAALREAGLNTIANLDELSTEARACKTFYPMIRDEVLRLHAWNFAQKRRSLALVELPQAYDQFEYSYAYPEDCFRLNRITELGKKTTEKYEVMRHPDNESRVVLTDAPSAVATYTATTNNPTMFDSEFERAVILSLAARLAASLRKDLSVEKLLQEKFARTVNSARTADAEEQNPVDEQPTPWLTARFTGEI